MVWASCFAKLHYWYQCYYLPRGKGSKFGQNISEREPGSRSAWPWRDTRPWAGDACCFPAYRPMPRSKQRNGDLRFHLRRCIGPGTKNKRGHGEANIVLIRNPYYPCPPLDSDNGSLHATDHKNQPMGQLSRCTSTCMKGKEESRIYDTVCFDFRNVAQVGFSLHRDSSGSQGQWLVAVMLICKSMTAWEEIQGSIFAAGAKTNRWHLE